LVLGPCMIPGKQTNCVNLQRPLGRFLTVMRPDISAPFLEGPTNLELEYSVYLGIGHEPFSFFQRIEPKGFKHDAMSNKSDLPNQQCFPDQEIIVALT